MSAFLDVPSANTRDFRVDVRAWGGTIEFDVPLEAGRSLHFAGRHDSSVIRGSVTGTLMSGTFELVADQNADRLRNAAPSAHGSTRWPAESWPSANPDASGIDQEKLAEGVAWITTNAPDVRALLIVLDGALVVEKYFGPATALDAFNTKSVTKSVVSAAMGVALQQRRFTGLDERLLDVLPERKEQVEDARKKSITLRHLASMTAGLHWQENGPMTAEWIASADSVGYALGLPMNDEPGRVFHYNTSLAHLLSAALSRRTGMSTRQYVEKHVLHPIGAKVVRWDRDQAGSEEGGSELYLTARDMARFGYLYLRGGRWNEKQIVSPEWVALSTRAQSRRDPFWADYGFLWWLEQNDDLQSFAAFGYGGQAIWITPELDLVVVLASTPSNPRNDPRELIVSYILPAVRGNDRLCPLRAVSR